MATVIQIRPAKTTPKGRQRPASYLVEFHYPPLFSSQRVTTTTTHHMPDAKQFRDTDQSLIESALMLLDSIGYDEAKAVHLDTPET